MLCPKCKNEDTSVRKSEKITGSMRVHRTRRCNFCRHQFQTTEKPNVSYDDKTPSGDGTCTE
jgi:transcriptional regulator NrdR family protein